MSRVVGVPKAKELIFTGKILNGTEAAAIGLVNQVVEKDPFEKALQISEDILKTVSIQTFSTDVPAQTVVKLSILRGCSGLCNAVSLGPDCDAPREDRDRRRLRR